MGVVVDLFSGKPIPAAEGSDFVTEFVEGPLGDLAFALDRLGDAKSETEFRGELKGIKELVAGWPG